MIILRSNNSRNSRASYAINAHEWSIKDIQTRWNTLLIIASFAPAPILYREQMRRYRNKIRVRQEFCVRRKEFDKRLLSGKLVPPLRSPAGNSAY